MQSILKHQKLVLKIISLIQIIGGIAGLFLIAYLLMHIETMTGPNLLIILIGLGLFIFSIYCGKLLLNGISKTGITLSIVNQTLQIFQWSIWGYGFAYNSGVSVTFGIKDTSIDFVLAATMSTFQMSIRSENPFLFKINIVAVVIIIILIEIYSSSKRLGKVKDTEDFGTEAKDV